MNDKLNQIERERMLAAEREVVAGIPADLLAHMVVADAKFAAEGGCKGCGSKLIGVHKGGCPTGRDDFY